MIGVARCWRPKRVPTARSLPHLEYLITQEPAWSVQQINCPAYLVSCTDVVVHEWWSEFGIERILALPPLFAYFKSLVFVEMRSVHLRCVGC